MLPIDGVSPTAVACFGFNVCAGRIRAASPCCGSADREGGRVTAGEQDYYIRLNRFALSRECCFPSVPALNCRIEEIQLQYIYYIVITLLFATRRRIIIDGNRKWRDAYYIEII